MTITEFYAKQLTDYINNAGYVVPEHLINFEKAINKKRIGLFDRLNAIASGLDPIEINYMFRDLEPEALKVIKEAVSAL